MARIRSIKGEFFLDSDLGRKPPLARLLFAGLWIHADRKGVLEEELARLKHQILPYDKASIGKLLARLTPKHIVRYEAMGKKLIWIRNFAKHQHPHQKEQDSNLPLPSEEQKKP